MSGFTLVDCDRGTARRLRLRRARVLRTTSCRPAVTVDGPAVLSTSASHLGAAVAFVAKCGSLAGILVRQDMPAESMARMVDRLPRQSGTPVVIYQSEDLASVLINAWEMGLEHETVLQANLLGDLLEVITCEFEVVEVPVSAIRWLRGATPEQLADFRVEMDGQCLSWPQLGVDLDLDGLRCIVDPEVRERALMEKARHDHRFGAAVRKVRKAHGLRQADIDGLSERQVRRIEQGNFPRLTSIRKLARAHGLEANDYLNEVAEAIGTLPEE